MFRRASPSISELNAKLRLLIDDLAINTEVRDALLPNGQPHDFEGAFWDYKEGLPSLIENPSEADRKSFKAEIGEIIKDALAFHNAYGGYIVFGVLNKGANRIRGCTGHFDCGDFNKRFQSYTGVNVECIFHTMPVGDHPGAPSVGFLLIPRRPNSVKPLRFTKPGPERSNGSRCFNAETYVRIRDECRPATATSEDWEFLHSDRNPAEIAVRPNRPDIRAFLPPRDPDLVKFVGREDTLAELRKWLTDPRSPVRLVTGIGGLGKTTVSYRFAEEVVRTGAGEVEVVVWLTAKQRTYSALRGRLVETSQVDFSDLATALQAILTALSHELPPDEEDPTLDQLTERVVEALESYTCLIVVDDIDSLLPTEQRETVAALNGIALRTVGREIPASRILMTSRIDQGMPATAVLKISGLDRKEFSDHVGNLCDAFRIPRIYGPILDSFFESTSGSPLFAASLIRLVKQGENLRTVIQTWRGQDGEDVRNFAFKREISRLTTSQGQLLYAVLLLQETSVNDLANLLDVTAKVVRERISELQSYHLISTSIKESGDAVVVPPSDLIAVTDILRIHLGPDAKPVELACARAQANSSMDNRAIGAGIRRVVAAWNNSRPDEALIIANELKHKFPKNGDIANIRGQALLKVVPAKLEEADTEFDKARALGCGRPELLRDSIRVKLARHDWNGVYQLTRLLRSNTPALDLPLSAFLEACDGLISNARVRRDDARIAELCLEAFEKLGAKFHRFRLDKDLFNQLNERRLAYAREYLRALDRIYTRAGDKVAVFDGFIQIAAAGVAPADLVSVGLSALEAWWGDVEKRPIVDLTACSILNRKLLRLAQIERALAPYASTRQDMMQKIGRVRKDLEHRGGVLSRI